MRRFSQVYLYTDGEPAKKLTDVPMSRYQVKVCRRKIARKLSSTSNGTRSLQWLPTQADPEATPLVNRSDGLYTYPRMPQWRSKKTDQSKSMPERGGRKFPRGSALHIRIGRVLRSAWTFFTGTVGSLARLSALRSPGHSRPA